MGLCDSSITKSRIFLIQLKGSLSTVSAQKS